MSYHSNDSIILEYINEHNRSPFRLWFSNLCDDDASRVTIAVYRLSLGNTSNCKSIGKGLWEIKLVYGAGLRIYYGKRGNKIILLWGGTKHRQSEDIKRATLYWSEYSKAGEFIEWH